MMKELVLHLRKINKKVREYSHGKALKSLDRLSNLVLVGVLDICVIEI